METSMAQLIIVFDGKITDRDNFLESITGPVRDFTGEIMRLDALIKEIAKNIFDHAEGKGSLHITKNENSYTFIIKDEGTASFDTAQCKKAWVSKNKGTNFGIGLELITVIAQSLEIDMNVDTSKGFTYSGTYVPKTSQ